MLGILLSHNMDKLVEFTRKALKRSHFIVYLDTPLDTQFQIAVLLGHQRTPGEAAIRGEWKLWLVLSASTFGNTLRKRISLVERYNAKHASNAGR